MAVPLAPVTSHTWDIGEVGRAEMMIDNEHISNPRLNSKMGLLIKKMRILIFDLQMVNFKTLNRIESNFY